MGSRSVIVTGAGSGIGRAVAERFAHSGDKLVLVDKDEESGRLVTEMITKQGRDVSFLHMDVSKKLDVHNVIAEALDLYDRIDVLAHCDGYFFSAPLLEISEEDFEKTIRSNLFSAFLLNQAVAKQIIKQSGDPADGGVDQARTGAIVNITTTEAVTASADHALFAAVQGGLTQLTKAVAMTLSPYGARANAVGVASIRKELEDVETDLSGRAADAAKITPLSRKGEPEEAANAIHFLASPEASFITGQTLFVDGGRLAMHGQGIPRKKEE
ncbi:MAG: SDR family oxidoreductase [Aquisalinus sp.]|nr:SDR family oxidoreductase [Aquisalinus sp.]